MELECRKKRMEIYILPFAGGCASYFKFWKEALEKEKIKVHCIDFKGRASRRNEKTLNNFTENLNDFYEIIMRSQEEFIIWGHSLGTLFAWELGVLFEHNVRFKGLICSGRTSPKYTFLPKQLNYEGLKDYIMKTQPYSQKFWETPIGVLQMQALLHDYKILETYQYTKHILVSKARILYSTDDSLCVDIYSWEKFITNIKIVKFEGDHFFISEKKEDILKEIIDFM